MRYTLELLDAMPQEGFATRPHPDARSFAELMLHLAESSRGFASLLCDASAPAAGSGAEALAKADVRKELLASFEFVGRCAKSVPEARWSESLPWNNRFESTSTRSRSDILAILIEHAAHHRGQATVYLRLRGVRPPDYVD